MRRSWLVAAASIVGAAGVAQAADVQIFGIHTPDPLNPAQSIWAVYGRISNAASSTPLAGRPNVVGISSVSVDVLNANGNVVTASQNKLPFGTTDATDIIDEPAPGDPNPVPPQPVGYGFWLFRSNGTVSAQGAKGVQASQYAEFDPANPSYFSDFVLERAGLSSGSQAIGGHFTSATNWRAPLLIAQGTYTPGPNSNLGMTVQFGTGSGVNLLKDTDATAAEGWTGPSNLETPVTARAINAQFFTGTGPLEEGTTHATVRAGLGDTNLNGTVGLEDLVTLATYYGGPGTWFEADFNHNGVVGLEDLVTLATYYGGPAPAPDVMFEYTGSAQFAADYAAVFSSVPEPGSISFLAMAAAAVTMRRRTKHTS